MSARGGAALYTPEILALAVDLAAFPLVDELSLRGEAVSRICGSRVSLGLSMADGVVERIGARVTACAIGQAAAAIFLRSAAGRDLTDLTAAREGMEAWLAGAGPLPDWPCLAILEPARAYPARHGAILLPWKAAVAALSNPPRAE